MTPIPPLLQLIENLELSKTYLANKMGITLNQYNNKFSAQPRTIPSDADINKLCVTLIEMRDELGIVESADFNDALKIMSGKKV